MLSYAELIKYFVEKANLKYGFEDDEDERVEILGGKSRD